MISRRSLISSAAGGLTGLAVARFGSLSRLLEAASSQRVAIGVANPAEDIFTYVERVMGTYDDALYRQVLGAANEFKEGDEIVNVAALDERSRVNARRLIAQTRIRDLDDHPLLEDQLSALLAQDRDSVAASATGNWTLGELKQFLLEASEAEIKSIMAGLSSEAIGCVVKLMSNDELIVVASKVFNPLPGSRIGARGYLGARIQPNSPTDNIDDIRWQVFDGFSYGVGDVLLGTNPVSSNPASVAAVESALQDLLVTFGIDDAMPHCVLSHIDVQAAVEATIPGSTALWFQSIAGSDAANGTFDIDTGKMLDYAAARTGRYGLYFETGQGADFTNGHDHGFDMVLHESRKYGFARALAGEVSRVDGRSGSPPWVHLNDVAGFIGPEVFRTPEQLVRCCLEDIVMGKLHGLCIGLDVCSTLHMDISLDDLDWCLEQVMPANPAYLMGLPTKIDPMLGYLSTAFQDHVRLRERFGYKVNDRMWRFFQELGVIDELGVPTEHFGDPLWVFLHYRRRKGDARSDDELRAEGEQQLAEIHGRGVFIARGHGQRHGDLEPALDQDIRRIYADSKESIWTELDADFVARIRGVVRLRTRSLDREDYILHPQSGERLAGESEDRLGEIRQQHAGRYDVQIVVSDGLNALAIMDEGHLDPFLQHVQAAFDRASLRLAPEHLVVTSGRVRAGYRIGETLFADLPRRRAIVHVIGERPGTGHHTFSTYISAPVGSVWASRGTVDHNITRVVSGIATTALAPTLGADEVVRILGEMM